MALYSLHCADVPSRNCSLTRGSATRPEGSNPLTLQRNWFLSCRQPAICLFVTYWRSVILLHIASGI